MSFSFLIFSHFTHTPPTTHPDTTQTAEMERDRLIETVSQRNRLIADQSSRLAEQEQTLKLSQGRERVLSDELRNLKVQLENALTAANSAHGTTPRDSADMVALKEEVRRLTEALGGATDAEAALRSTLNDTEKRLELSLAELSAKNTQLVEARQEAREALAAKESAESTAMSLRADLNRAASSNASLSTENDRLKEELAAANAALGNMKNAHGSSRGKEDALRKELEQTREELAKAQRGQNDCLSKMDALKRELDAQRKAAAAVGMKLAAEAQSRVAESERADQAEAARRTLEQELNRLREALAAMQRELAAKEKELARLRSMAKKGMSSAGDLKSDLERLKNKLGVAQAECAAVREQLEVMMQRARDAEMALNKKKTASKMMEAELKRCEKDLGMEQTISEKLRSELAEAAKRMAALKANMREATQRARKEALESSLQSMVRLCVVAPTVNVHFNSQEHACKAPMPASRIRGIIENDVLPNFTSLFLQLEEGKAQDGSKLDLWLEDMLAEMQRSIQSHLADVFKEQSGSGGGSGGSHAQADAGKKRPGSSQSGRARPRMGGNRGGQRRPSTRAG